MNAMHVAQVKNGRLTLDEPTDLPEGSVVLLEIADDWDDLDDEERAALHIMGTEYEADVGFPVRRVLLKESATHVYFGLTGDELAVLSVSGARRKRGPKL